MAYTTKEVELYICPTPGCGSYYGGNNMPDLSKSFTGPRVEDRAKLREETGSGWRHTRSSCPECRIRGESVERVRMRVEVGVPIVAPALSNPLR